MGRSFESQQLRECDILGHRYHHATAVYKYLEKEEQVVLEGTLCNSRHMSLGGKCTFDRSMATDISDLYPESKQRPLPVDAPPSSSAATKEVSAGGGKKPHAEHKVHFFFKASLFSQPY